jgi:hypothetical protein
VPADVVDGRAQHAARPGRVGLPGGEVW